MNLPILRQNHESRRTQVYYTIIQERVKMWKPKKGCMSRRAVSCRIACTVLAIVKWGCLKEKEFSLCKGHVD